MAKNNKKIIFIVHSMGGGGSERVISILSNYLIENGYDVTLLLTHSNNCVYNLNPKIKTVLRENVSSKDGLNQIKFIRTQYKKDKNAIFVSFLRRQNLYSLIAAIGLNVKLIFSERNNPDEKFSIKNKYTYEMRLIKELSRIPQVKQVVFQTEGARACYPAKTQKKSQIIANPLKEDLPVPYEGKREKRIVAVGRLTYQKNYPLLLKTFKRFSEKHNDYTLEIYGDGSQKMKLQAYIIQLGIQDKARLCGFSTDIHNDIFKAGMYIMSSRYEGLSNALLEAMALGLPVISTDHPPGGAKAFIKSYENGILTENGNEEELFNAMCYIAEKEEKALQMGKNASEIREVLSTEKICRQWEEIFRRY